MFKIAKQPRKKKNTHHLRVTIFNHNRNAKINNKTKKQATNVKISSPT